VRFAMRPFGRVLLPVILAAAVVPSAAAAAGAAPAAESAAGATGLAWAGATAPVAGLNPAPTAPNGDGVVLGSVSCPGTGSCVAVGHYTSATAGSVPLAETLSGGSWTATAVPTAGLDPSPNPAIGVLLTKVSCPAPGTCVAIGTYVLSSNGEQSVIATLSGGTWTAMTAPAPAADQRVVLRGVSCPAAGSCVAAGFYQDLSGSLHPLIDTLSGGTWTAADLPVGGLSPAAASNVILALVSCPVTGTCAAAGSYNDTSGHRQGLLASLANGTWTGVTAPTSALNPGPWTSPALTFSSLSCPAAGSCFAVGSYLAVPDKQDGLIATLANGTWSGTTAPVSGLTPPAGTNTGDSVNLNAVSCPAAGSCVAVGVYQDTSNNRDGFTETLSGGTWSPADIPMTGLVPTGLFVNSFTGISCPSAGSCAATGTYQDISGPTASQNGIEHGLLDTLSGGTWTAAAAPTYALKPPQIYTTDPLQPPYQVPVTPDSVACPVVGACVAVGYYSDPAQSVHALIETLSDAATPAPGYWIATTGANVYQFNAPAYTTQAATGTVGIAADGPGFQLVTNNGAVTSYNAPNYGSHTGTLKAPVVGIAVNPATGGYYLATSAGNAYPYNAPFYGSKAGHTLPSPVDGIATDGPGYLLVTKAGNVYAFNTPFYGSRAGHHLPAPIVGITADPATGGYWLATSAGNVYSFNAPFYGSEAGKSLPGPISGIVADGTGYLLVGKDGSVYNFNTPFYGSEAGKNPPSPVIGITAAG
jgi:hypothetical protein